MKKINKFKVKESDITQKVKKVIERFIETSETLDSGQKHKLQEELQSERFHILCRTDNLIQDAEKYAVESWIKENKYFAQLWSKVVVENSAINNNPEE